MLKFYSGLSFGLMIIGCVESSITRSGPIIGGSLGLHVDTNIQTSPSCGSAYGQPPCEATSTVKIDDALSIQVDGILHGFTALGDQATQSSSLLHVTTEALGAFVNKPKIGISYINLTEAIRKLDISVQKLPVITDVVLRKKLYDSFSDSCQKMMKLLELSAVIRYFKDKFDIVAFNSVLIKFRSTISTLVDDLFRKIPVTAEMISLNKSLTARIQAAIDASTTSK